MAIDDPTEVLADVRDSLAGIAALAAVLSGAQPHEVDRTALALLIKVRAECAALKLESARKVQTGVVSRPRRTHALVLLRVLESKAPHSRRR